MAIRLEGMTLYTVKDLAALLGLGDSTVRRYIKDGRLKGRKMARRWYVPAESLLEYFQETDIEPPAALFTKLEMLDAQLEKPPSALSLGRPKTQKRADPVREEKLKEEEQFEDLSDLQQLIRKAKQLKREAVRIEQKYSMPNIMPDEEL